MRFCSRLSRLGLARRAGCGRLAGFRRLVRVRVRVGVRVRAKVRVHEARVTALLLADAKAAAGVAVRIRAACR